MRRDLLVDEEALQKCCECSWAAVSQAHCGAVRSNCDDRGRSTLRGSDGGLNSSSGDGDDDSGSSRNATRLSGAISTTTDGSASTRPQGEGEGQHGVVRALMSFCCCYRRFRNAPEEFCKRAALTFASVGNRQRRVCFSTFLLVVAALMSFCCCYRRFRNAPEEFCKRAALTFD